ncbi:type II toxin-antitoxin system HicB family antitoxin [Natrinema sp. JCM 9743]
MSTDTGSNGTPEPQTTITLTQEGNWWVAKDEDTGVSSQGTTRIEALENLDEAVAGYNGEGREPTEEELREIGIDPAKNTSGESLPDDF